MNSLPSVLYKYCPPRRIDVLEMARIAFSSPAILNDIFELLPNVDLGNPGRYEAIVSSTLRSCRYLCLAEDWCNPLMWSYYCESYAGFVVGLDTGCRELFAVPPRPIV